MEESASQCHLIIVCEGAGPAQDEHCYTMRSIDMTINDLIASLHRLVKMRSCPFVTIGDGGDEFPPPKLRMENRLVV
jgi:hypothetical protein